MGETVPFRRNKLDTGARIAGSLADHRPSDYRYPRTQREAGIEFAEWEDRLSPIRPWMFWLAVTLCWVVFGAAAWVMVG